MFSIFGLLGGSLPILSQTRSATKKAGGSVKRQNHNRKRKGKRYGPKVDQGIKVLYKQYTIVTSPLSAWEIFFRKFL